MGVLLSRVPTLTILAQALLFLPPSLPSSRFYTPYGLGLGVSSRHIVLFSSVLGGPFTYIGIGHIGAASPYGSLWRIRALAAPAASARMSTPPPRARPRPSCNPTWECTNIAAAIAVAFGGGNNADRWHLDICRKFQAGDCRYERSCSHFHPGLDPVHTKPTSAERAKFKASRDDDRKRARYDTTCPTSSQDHDTRNDRDISASRILNRYSQGCVGPAPSAVASLAAPSHTSDLVPSQAPCGRPPSSSSAVPGSQQRTTSAGRRRSGHQSRRGRGGPGGWLQFGVAVPTLDLLAIKAGFSPSHAAAQPLSRGEQRASKTIITFLRDWELIRQSMIAFTAEGFVNACDLQVWSERQGHEHDTLFRCIMISRSKGRDHGRFELVNNRSTDQFWVRAASLGSPHTDGGHAGIVADSSDESVAYPESWLQDVPPEGTAAGSVDFRGHVKDEDLPPTQPYTEPLDCRVKNEDFDGRENLAESGVV